MTTAPILQRMLVTPVYFLATKFEAYKGKGNDDVLGSRDIEDILHLIDGRAELINEVQSADQLFRSISPQSYQHCLRIATSSMPLPVSLKVILAERI